MSTVEVRTKERDGPFGIYALRGWFLSVEPQVNGLSEKRMHMVFFKGGFHNS